MQLDHHLKNKLDLVILTGRPASGKSEIITYLKALSRSEKKNRFGLGEIDEIDDFPFVWETFEIDDILQKHGRERIFTTPDLYFKDEFIWTLFIERINLEFNKRLAKNPYYFQEKTIFVEFSRGGERGMEEAFLKLAPEILKKASILYINVSYEESLKKNRLRKRPGELDSILYHSLPDDKMEYYYKVNDWEKLTQDKQGVLMIQNIPVPFVVFDNEPDRTSDSKLIGPALEDVFSRLRQVRVRTPDLDFGLDVSYEMGER